MHGFTLNEAWEDGPHAYRSVAVPGFPNLFMLMGPHSPVGNQSLVIIAENQADYAMWWINQIREGRVASAAPKEAATKEYNEEIKAAMPQTVWLTGCKSWYLGKNGLPELFPWIPRRHRELLRTPELADFDVRSARCDGRHIAADGDPSHTRSSIPAGSAVRSGYCTRV